MNDKLKELLDLIGSTSDTKIHLVDMDDGSNSRKLAELLDAMKSPKGARDVSTNKASYLARIDQAVTEGDMTRDTADHFIGMEAWMDTQASDEQKFALIQLKELGFGAFSALWLVRDRGFDAERVCLMKYSVALACDQTRRGLANEIMHAAHDHGLGVVAAQLALDYDAHQTKAEAWYVELSTACVAVIGEDLGQFPSAGKIDLEDSRIATERLHTAYKEVVAKAAGQIQEG